MNFVRLCFTHNQMGAESKKTAVRRRKEIQILDCVSSCFGVVNARKWRIINMKTQNLQSSSVPLFFQQPKVGCRKLLYM